MVVGSPNVSMLSTTPLAPSPSRDTQKATYEWVNTGEDRVQSQPKRRQPADEEPPEDKQRPRCTLTKHHTNLPKLKFSFA